MGGIMRKSVPLFLSVIVLASLLLPATAQASPKPSFDQAIDTLYAQGYPQGIDNHLYSMPGTNAELGFAWAGTWADNDRATYLANEMRAIGLKNVHLEPVPVDVFDFKSANVIVGCKTMLASTFAGIPPTPTGGLTAQVVYAHEGTAQDFDTLASEGVSVAGKLVLIDADPTNFWMNCPAGEATERGAIGVIFTFGPTTAPYWTYATDVLGSFDGTYNMSFVPAVYISQQDGAWLESQLDSDGVGPVATMNLVESVRMATEGGTGYNVVGDLLGTSRDDSFVLFGSHHDIHFRAGTDDTSCVAHELAMAKAMVMSGYRPLHTVRFLITTGEEFGYTNAYNDWCIGAWYAITQTHPDWAGKIRAFFNEDYFSGSVSLHLASPDFAPLLTTDAAKWASLLPYGCTVDNVQSTWQDGWTFGAAGVPTVSIGSVPPNEDNGTYHTQYMLPSQVDWPYLADISKFLFRVEGQFNAKSVLPYDLASQADDLSAAVVPSSLEGVNADQGAIDRLIGDIAAFKAASVAFAARAGSIPAGHVDSVNTSLRQIEKTYALQLLGITPFQTTVYRHTQVLLDVQCLDAAVEALQNDDPSDALAALSGVDFTYYGTMLSHPVYLQILAPLDPSYDRVCWGGQANPVWPLLDVMPQYNAILADSWDDTTIAQLTAMSSQELNELNSRLNAMSAALEQLIPQINALR